jgi:hypothetical protein
MRPAEASDLPFGRRSRSAMPQSGFRRPASVFGSWWWRVSCGHVRHPSVWAQDIGNGRERRRGRCVDIAATRRPHSPAQPWSRAPAVVAGDRHRDFRARRAKPRGHAASARISTARAHALPRTGCSPSQFVTTSKSACAVAGQGALTESAVGPTSWSLGDGSVQMGLPTNGQLKNWRGGKPADGCVRDPECTFDT